MTVPMTHLGPESDRAVREAVDAYLEGRLRPEIQGEALFATRNSEYRLIDGVLFSCTDSALIGAELVGWLTESGDRSAVTSHWRPGVRAVLVDRRHGRHIVITSGTKLLRLDGAVAGRGSQPAHAGSGLDHEAREHPPAMPAPPPFAARQPFDAAPARAPTHRLPSVAAGPPPAAYPGGAFVPKPSVPQAAPPPRARPLPPVQPPPRMPERRAALPATTTPTPAHAANGRPLPPVAPPPRRDFAVPAFPRPTATRGHSPPPPAPLAGPVSPRTRLAGPALAEGASVPPPPPSAEPFPLQRAVQRGLVLR